MRTIGLFVCTGKGSILHFLTGRRPGTRVCAAGIKSHCKHGPRHPYHPPLRFTFKLNKLMPIRKSGLNYVTQVINSRCRIEVGLWPSLMFSCVLSHSVVSNSLRPYGQYPARLLCPWDSPGKNTGVGCHALLQGIFPTQG